MKLAVHLMGMNPCNEPEDLLGSYLILGVLKVSDHLTTVGVILFPRNNLVTLG